MRFRRRSITSLKFFIYCFSDWYECFVHCALRFENNLSVYSRCGTPGISEGMPHQPIQDSVAGKTAGVIILTQNFVFIGHRDYVFARCDSIFPLLRCKECGTQSAHKFLLNKSSFRIRRPTAFGMSKDSAIILDAIRRSFVRKSATAAMFTSVRIDFGRPLRSSCASSLPSRNPENYRNTFDRIRATCP